MVSELRPVYLIRYNGEFYWNGEFAMKDKAPHDPKLFWTTNWCVAGKIYNYDLAQKMKERFFNYPVEIVETIDTAD